MVNMLPDRAVASHAARRVELERLQRLCIAFLAAPMLPALVEAWLISRPDRMSLDLLVLFGSALYVMQIVVGAPGYAVLRELRHNGLFAYLILGFVTVALPMIWVSLYACSYKSCLAMSFLHSAFLGLFGLPLGAVFWLIARPDLHDRRLQDAIRNTR